MAREGTWVFDTNRANGGAATAAGKAHWMIWYIVKWLSGNAAALPGIDTTTGVWTVAESSDGVGNYLAGDLFDDAFNDAEFVQAAAGVNHTWVLLTYTDTDATVYRLLIDYLAAASANLLTIKFGTGGAAGNATTAATVTSAYYSSAVVAITDNAATAYKAHGAREAGGWFDVLASKNGSGWFCSAMIARKLKEVSAADAYPWVYSSFYGSGVDLLMWSNGGAVGTRAAPAAASGAAPPGFGARKYDGNLYAVGPSLPVILADGGTTKFCIQTVGFDQDADGLYPLYEAWAMHSNGPIKGRFPDFFWHHQSRSDGDVYPAVGAVEYVCIGEATLPMDAAPSL